MDAEKRRDLRVTPFSAANSYLSLLSFGVEDFIFDLIGQQIEGDGAMMLTTEITQDMFHPARFVMVPLTGSPWQTKLYLARLKDMPHSPAAQALHQFLLEKWSDSSQPSVVNGDE